MITFFKLNHFFKLRLEIVQFEVLLRLYITADLFKNFF